MNGVIIDDSTKESKELMALLIVQQSKIRYGKDADMILDWLIGENCINGKSEVPDFS
jgi:hypothetical protein